MVVELDFHILTVFPQLYRPFIRHGILARGIENEALSIRPWSLRRFTDDDYGQIDDSAYGGDFGMVMKPEPYFRGVDHIKKHCSAPKVLLMAPDGKKFDNKAAKSLSNCPEIIILTGRYEGVDERVREYLVDETWSIGPYVTPGGDLPALVMISAISRQVPGVVGNSYSVQEDTFQDGELAPPHYTRPADFRGMKVPEVLLSGNHAKIAAWRDQMAQERMLHYQKEILSNENDE